MDLKNDFKQLYKASQKSALKKSLFYSLFISFSTLFVTSFVFWILNVKEYWIAFIAFSFVFILSLVLLYILFKPNEKKFARELDSLGLKQRAITMYEYQNDDSLMARVQRQNAVEHITKVNKGLIKFVVPTFLLVVTITAVVLGFGSTTVSALSAKGIIKNGKETIRQVVPALVSEYDVKYIAKGNGSINGDTIQVVKEGQDASAVIAVAQDGYVFLAWSDGNKNPYRHDREINKNIEVYATFVTVEQYLELVKDPGKPITLGEPGNSNRPGQEGESGGDENDPRSKESNMVIDGDTYYGDETLDQYASQAIDDMSQDGDLDEGSKEIANDYFDTIEK